MENQTETPQETPRRDDNPVEDGAKKPCPACPCPRKSFPRGKLESYDWLADIPGSMAESDLVEVVFKNTRKGFYRNSSRLDLAIGDIVAVEATPGHDIGRVSLTGKLVELQMRRAGIKPGTELKRVFRIAKPSDLEKYEEARARENDTMVRSRRIAEELKLNMKIGDVEYQGDGNKAIFYYIADERVDFRQLIRILADTFKVRIEMKQIGARQEAGRIGGIGPCGRPLCCASWMTSFVTVGTAAARYQDISLNPQKLAGQCAKLKCCLNFEVDAYMESLKQLPGKEVRLETKDNTYYHFKYDIFRHEITYSTDKNIAANLVTISAERAFEVIAMNKAGEKPDSLLTVEEQAAAEKTPYNDILGQDITRFDKKKKSRSKKKADENPDKPSDKAADKGDEKAEKTAKPSKAAKAEKTEKQEKGERPDKSEKEEKTRRKNRQERRQRGGGQGGFRPEDDTPEGVPAPRKNIEESRKPAPDKAPDKSTDKPADKPSDKGGDKPKDGAESNKGNKNNRRRPGNGRNRRPGNAPRKANGEGGATPAASGSNA